MTFPDGYHTNSEKPISRVMYNVKTVKKASLLLTTMDFKIYYLNG